MEIEVVVPQGLLDHKQVKSVERRDVIFVAKAIGRIGVATEHNAGPAFAHLLKHFHIPARLAFEFDALVAGGKFTLNDGKQFGNRMLNAKRYAARNRLANAADQARKRDAFALRFKIPNGVFE